MVDPSEGGATGTGWLESRLQRHKHVLLGVVLLLAVLARLVVFVQLNEGPLLHLQDWEQSDMHFFDAWGRAIATGDLLSAEVGHPQHLWHRAVADAHFSRHPEARGALARERGTDDPAALARALWDDWYGGPTFHQEPFYPYLVGATYALLGPDARWVFAWQMTLGLLTTALLFSMTWRWFGAVAAGAAGLLVALYGPVLFYEMVLLRVTLRVFLGVLLVWLAERAWKRRDGAAALSLGVGLGVSVLVKSTFALFGLVLLAWIAWPLRRRPLEAMRAVAPVVAGVVLCLVPAAARNLAVGAPTLALSSVGPISLCEANVMGNAPLGVVATAPQTCARVMAEGDGRLLGVAWATLRTHTGAGSVVAAVASKFQILFAAREVPHNANFYYAGRQSWLLGHLPFGFGLLAALGVIGIYPALRRHRYCIPLLLMLLCNLALLLGFYVFSRFRMTLSITLVPFAGLTVALLLEWLAGKRWRDVAALTLLVTTVAAFVLWPRPSLGPRVRFADYAAPYIFYYEPRMAAATEAGRFDEAVEELERFLATAPAGLGSGNDPTAGYPGTSPRLLAYFAQKHQAAANAHERLGRPQEAQRHRDRSRALLDAYRKRQAGI